jgi:hypothetical protein
MTIVEKIQFLIDETRLKKQSLNYEISLCDRLGHNIEILHLQRERYLLDSHLDNLTELKKELEKL